MSDNWASSAVTLLLGVFLISRAVVKDSGLKPGVDKKYPQGHEPWNLVDHILHLNDPSPGEQSPARDPASDAARKANSTAIARQEAVQARRDKAQFDAETRSGTPKHTRAPLHR